MKKLDRLIGILIAGLVPTTALAADWAWTSDPTPGSQNNIATANGDTPEQYENGTLSEAIILSELMPNPEGTDNDTEWIELYNTGTVNVDLGNWSLDDEEGGSSPYVFPAGTVIEAQDFLVITRADSKISLNNDADKVRLFDFQDTLKDNVAYEGSPEGQSYARISLEKDATGTLARLIPTARAEAWYDAPWEWTQDITQGALNPVYRFIAGTVTELIPFEDQVVLKTSDRAVTVSLKGLTLNPELKTTIFSVGNDIQGYAVEKNNLLELRRFEEVLPSPASRSSAPHKQWLYVLLMMAASAVAFIYRRKITNN